MVNMYITDPIFVGSSVYIRIVPSFIETQQQW